VRRVGLVINHSAFVDPSWIIGSQPCFENDVTEIIPLTGVDVIPFEAAVPFIYRTWERGQYVSRMSKRQQQC
jgi:hypothetical protein